MLMEKKNSYWNCQWFWIFETLELLYVSNEIKTFTQSYSKLHFYNKQITSVDFQERLWESNLN